MFKKLVSVMLALFVITMASAVEAKVQTVEADGYYIVGDGPDENHSVAKIRAKMDAKRAAVEKVMVYVESVSTNRNGLLTRDEINTISAQVTEIESEIITTEVNGTVIRYCCHIVAKVDSSNVNNKLQQDKQKLHEAVEQNKRQQKELDALKKELTELKEQYQKANEAKRNEINKKIAENEDKFTAIEWLQEGYSYILKGDYQMAIACYERAIQLDPNNDLAWYGLALSNRYLGNRQKAIECLQEAIKINPNDEASLFLLGSFYLTIDYQKTLEYTLRSLQINPNNPSSCLNVGIAYSGLGNYTKAQEYLQKAIQLQPNNDFIWAMLGLNYNLLGDKEKAKECYKMSLEINPNNDFAQRLLGEL